MPNLACCSQSDHTTCHCCFSLLCCLAQHQVVMVSTLEQQYFIKGQSRPT